LQKKTRKLRVIDLLSAFGKLKAKQRILFFAFSAEDQTPQTTISNYENVVWGGIFVNRV
jgi:hypothetical protein